MRRRAGLFPVLLGLALFLQPAVALAVRQVTRNVEYPSPIGKYDDLTVSGTLTMGVTPSAPTGGSPPSPNPSNAAQASLTVFGNLYARNFAATEISIQEGLTVGTNAFRTNSRYWWGENHFVGINIPTGQDPDAELHVNGDIDAYEFRASNGGWDGDELLYFGLSDTSNSNDGEYGQWVQMGARHGIGGWSHGESIARIRGNPNILLNTYSHANVGIGTKNPVYKLQVGEAGSGLAAIGFAGGWKTFSSRTYKTDIRPLSAGECLALSDQAAALNVVRFHYKEDRPSDKKLIGVLAEEAPKDILGHDGKAVGLGQEAAFLFATIKGLEAENRALEADVARLEAEVAALERGKGAAR